MSHAEARKRGAKKGTVAAMHQYASVFNVGSQAFVFLCASASPRAITFLNDHPTLSTFHLCLGAHGYIRAPVPHPDMPKDLSIKSVLLIGSGPIPDTTSWFRDHRPSPLTSARIYLNLMCHAEGQ